MISVIALFIALGGSAYAVATIGKGDIKENAVRSKHVKDGQIKPADLNADALDGSAVLTSRFHVQGGTFDQPTVYGPVSGMEDAYVPAVDGTTESNFQMVSPGRDLVARDMVANFGNVSHGSARRLVLRVDGADTALQCEFSVNGGGPGSCSPPAGTEVAIPAGSKLAWKTDKGSACADACNTSGTVISASLILED